jgi:hypothetical protein
MTAGFLISCISINYGAFARRSGFSDDFGRYHVERRFTGSPHIHHVGYFLCYGYPPLFLFSCTVGRSCRLVRMFSTHLVSYLFSCINVAPTLR